MSEDLDAIIQYVEQPNTDYAFMLTGPWGSGKTYFWKHVVVPRLDSMKSSASGERAVLFISLYGLKDVDEIRKAFLSQLSPKLVKFGKLASNIAPFLGMFGLPTIESEQASNVIDSAAAYLGKDKKLVICFDDLERTALPIDVALGQINQFVEHMGAKVVILCHEAEIRFAEYLRTKEKVVRITRSFRPDALAIIPSVIAEFAADVAFHQFLLTHRELLNETIRRSELTNLRALRHAMLMLQIAHRGLCFADSNDLAMRVSVARALLPVLIERAIGRLSSEDGREFLARGAAAIIGAQMTKADDDKESALTAFADRYGFGGILVKTPTFQTIADFVSTNYLDERKLRTEFEQLNATRSPEQEAVEAILGGWFYHSDDEIPKLIALALSVVRNGRIESVERLYTLANVFGWMASEGVVVAVDETTRNTFRDGITLLAASWPLEDSVIFKLQNFPKFIESETAFATEIREIIIRENDAARTRGLLRRKNIALSRFQADPEELEFYLWDDSKNGIGRLPIATFVSAEEFTSLLSESTNSELYTLNNALRRRYREHHSIKELSSDGDWLRLVSTAVDAALAAAETQRPARSMLLKMAKRTLEDVIKSMSSLVA